MSKGSREDANLRCLEVDGRATQLHIRLADRWWRRAVGLLATVQLQHPCGMWLQPCGSVHTLGMRLTIDTVFVGTAGVVLKVVPALPPWRVAACRGAHAVLELREGLVAQLGLCAGSRLSLGVSLPRR